MIQSRNGQSDQLPKPKARYTGERLLRERPRVYRKVVELLAEPREQMSIRQICRLCRVTDDTVKAVEKREAISIAARKQTLLSIALNVAQLSGERLEELAPTMNAREAGVNFGIAIDKALLLNDDPNMRLEVNPGPRFADLYEKLNSLTPHNVPAPKAIQAQVVEPVTDQLALPNGETILDSAAENRFEVGRISGQKER
ncbi:MAG TPA: transposase family protein [Chthoniobacterales bacterium]|jgi:hypothetical protein|nr:transposase family protein [Chthoniobacterales bacterium]